MESNVQGLRSLVEIAKSNPRRTPDGKEFLPDDVKQQLNKIKAAFLSVTTEIDSIFSNNAVELLTKISEYLSLTVGEIEQVLKSSKNSVECDGLRDLLESLGNVKDEYRRFIDK